MSFLDRHFRYFLYMAIAVYCSALSAQEKKLTFTLQFIECTKPKKDLNIKFYTEKEGTMSFIKEYQLKNLNPVRVNTYEFKLAADITRLRVVCNVPGSNRPKSEDYNNMEVKNIEGNYFSQQFSIPERLCSGNKKESPKPKPHGKKQKTKPEQQQPKLSCPDTIRIKYEGVPYSTLCSEMPFIYEQSFKLKDDLKQTKDTLSQTRDSLSSYKERFWEFFKSNVFIGEPKVNYNENGFPLGFELEVSVPKGTRQLETKFFIKLKNKKGEYLYHGNDEREDKVYGQYHNQENSLIKFMFSTEYSLTIGVEDGIGFVIEVYGEVRNKTQLLKERPIRLCIANPKNKKEKQ